MRSVVVLPAPFGPMKLARVPTGTSKVKVVDSRALAEALRKSVDDDRGVHRVD
jgi:hypothetical protein